VNKGIVDGWDVLCPSLGCNATCGLPDDHRRCVNAGHPGCFTQALKTFKAGTTSLHREDRIVSHNPSSSNPSARQRRNTVDPGYRPIASSLQLPPAHTATIDDSHDRCAALGLSRFESPDLSPMARSDFSALRERNNRLYERAAPVMEMLFEQIVHTQSMVLLCDATGTVLHSLGDDDFLARASKVALQPGVNWSESAKGTNAIGTALVSEVPTLVHADEHFMHANHFLTCSAAPILDPRGNMLGVLDVTGDQRSFHQHTMALVKMSARMIENHWLTDDYRHVLRLHFHNRVEFIGTLKEGLLAITADGHVVGANRSALDQLGMSGAAVRMQTVETLFGVTVAQLVDHFRSPLATPFAAPLSAPSRPPTTAQHGGGQVMHLLARFDWPVWHTIAEAASGSVTSNGPAQGSTDAAPTASDQGATNPKRANVGKPRGVVSTPVTKPSVGQTQADESADDNGYQNIHAQAVLRTDDADAMGLAGVADAAGDDAVPLHRRRQTPPTMAALDTGDAHVSQVLDRARRVIDRNIPILILGEAGVGKGLLARTLHHTSRRRDKPFVALNCTTMPAAQLEVELFGLEAMMFRGARRQAQLGKVLQAHGGTLFLDEIGELPLDVQAQLLRVIQERQVVPMGSHVPITVDVSIICSTQAHLRDLIAAKRFREDLYYRLNGLAVKLPALRERSDVLALARATMARDLDGTPPVLDDDVQQLLLQSAWPGNVRQLVNVLRTACVMAAGEPVLRRSHLPDDFVDECAAHIAALQAASCGTNGRANHTRDAGATAAAAADGDGAHGVARGGAAQGTTQSLGAIEVEAIRAALDACGGNISEAAKRLGISRNTIYRRLRWNDANA
jgi:sigma-54 dependent transcriptional regulator, acetoin dehydrogenase operon transcriptional activator AcoR